MKKNGSRRDNGKKLYSGRLYLYEVISNCPRCRGAVFPLDTHWRSIRHLFKCFQCSRMFKLKNGEYVVWPPEQASSKGISKDIQDEVILPEC